MAAELMCKVRRVPEGERAQWSDVEMTGGYEKALAHRVIQNLLAKPPSLNGRVADAHSYVGIKMLHAVDTPVDPRKVLDVRLDSLEHLPKATVKRLAKNGMQTVGHVEGVLLLLGTPEHGKKGDKITLTDLVQIDDCLQHQMGVEHHFFICHQPKAAK